jgi:hypothetical protein
MPFEPIVPHTLDAPRAIPLHPGLRLAVFLGILACLALAGSAPSPLLSQRSSKAVASACPRTTFAAITKHAAVSLAIACARRASSSTMGGA